MARGYHAVGMPFALHNRPTRITEVAMPDHTGLTSYRVYTTDAAHVVHTPKGQGDGLLQHLRSHGFAAESSTLEGMNYDRLEIGRDVSAEVVQVVLDHWER
jgi:hypothetical protein